MKITSLFTISITVLLLWGAKCSKNPENEHRITPYTYALLSADAYEEQEKHLPPDWEVFMRFDETANSGLHLNIDIDSDGDQGLDLGSFIQSAAEQLLTKGGYYGKAYRNKKSNELVIAHRGTDPFAFQKEETEGIGAFFSKLVNTVRDIGADLKIYQGEVPEDQYMAAREFTQVVRDSFERKYKKDPALSFTGHSLGAVLAELCAIEQKTTAVTFESPGSLPMAQTLLDYQQSKQKSNQIWTYNAAPNLINTANAPIGSVTRLFPPLPQNQADTDQSNNFEDQLGDTYFKFSWQQHSIEQLLKSFDPKDGQAKVFAKVQQWPNSGGEDLKGMNYFLNPANHPHWWNQWFPESMDEAMLKDQLESALSYSTSENKTVGLYIIGNDEDNHLYGGTNYRDTLQAMAGNDTLRAYGGPDYLLAGKGDDHLYGGKGDDYLIGDDGKDHFYFQSPGFGDDVILDEDGILYLDGQILKGKAVKKGDKYLLDHQEHTLKLKKVKGDLLLQLGPDQIRLRNYKNGKFNLQLD
ncbi:MAG: hypothetical protein AAF985_17010 [Bacteroidota bacterium]